MYNIIHSLIPNKKQLKLKVLQNLNPELYEKVILNTDFLSTDSNLSKRLKFIKLNLKELPLCKLCNTPHERINDKGEISDYCSKKCMFNDKEFMKDRLKNVDQKKKTKKQEQTNISKYGVPFQSQRKEVKDILRLPKVSKEVFEKLMNKEWMIEQYVTLNKTSVEIAKDLNIFYGTVIDYLMKHDIKIQPYTNSSSIERNVLTFLEQFNISFETNVKGLLENKKLEIDIYFPDKNLGIEINGLYWHKGRKYHILDKTKMAEKAGIQLLHFTDWEWNEKQDICKNIIKTKLGLNKKIYARKCIIKEIDAGLAKKFIEKYHLHGYSSCNVKIGLFHEDELVSCLTFGKSRFNKKYEWELIRLCSKSDFNIIGGSSKLLKYFCKKYNPKSIISYCDRNISNGKIFEILNFKKINETGPGYFWTNGTLIYSRYQTQKHLLHKILKNYDPKLSETENMQNNRFERFYNCGNLVYELIVN